MEYKIVKNILRTCPDLGGLDDSAAAALLSRGEELVLQQGDRIYEEGAPLDDTFCLLLSGDLVVQKGGGTVGGIFEGQLFGEMAYFTNRQARTATVEVGSNEAAILKFRLSPDELRKPSFFSLRKCLGLQTWEKFVSTSQCWA